MTWWRSKCTNVGCGRYISVVKAKPTNHAPPRECTGLTFSDISYKELSLLIQF